ncbi:MAG: twin-arginine translocation signal domain-containing protein [Gemmatimonadaceae bacterium]
MGNKTMVISSTEQLLDGKTRRNFLKLMGIGGAVVFLPSMLTSCDDNDPTGPQFGAPAGSGPALVIDFSTDQGPGDSHRHSVHRVVTQAGWKERGRLERVALILFLTLKERSAQQE